MWNGMDTRMAQERHAMLLREAQQERLAHEALAANNTALHHHARLLMWIGQLLVITGQRLQTRSRAGMQATRLIHESK
jgi:hypothetical protein